MVSPTLLYDADCGVCRWMLARILTWDRSANLRVLALQTDEAKEMLAGVPQDEWMKSWHLVEPSGEVHSAGTAFAPLMKWLPGGSALGPVVRAFGLPLDLAYNQFASNRSFFGQFVSEDAKTRAQLKIDGRTRH